MYSAREVIKALERAGFRQTSQKGSHIKLRGLRMEKIQTVIVPNHKEIAKGTLQSILKQAEMSIAEFERYAK